MTLVDADFLRVEEMADSIYVGNGTFNFTFGAIASNALTGVRSSSTAPPAINATATSTARPWTRG